jgi:hypothetical protein
MSGETYLVRHSEDLGHLSWTRYPSPDLATVYATLMADREAFQRTFRGLTYGFGYAHGGQEPRTRFLTRVWKACQVRNDVRWFFTEVGRARFVTGDRLHVFHDADDVLRWTAKEFVGP